MEDEFFKVTELPNPEGNFCWDHTYLPGDMKLRALRLILTVFKLCNLSRIFALSRIVFFHGPPGSGKTTTAKAIINEAAKRLAGERCFCAEMNFSNLLSHDYGESEKLIAKAFKHIEELASSNFIVFILLDEVESVLTERKFMLEPNNPVDAVRGVNKVLKEIDNLSLHYSKVFFLATSNLPYAVDKAFVDRADRVFYIGLPKTGARACILKDLCGTMNERISSSLDASSGQFTELVCMTKGLSGRAIRKLPVDAISSSDELSKDPSKIRLDDLVRAAQNLRESRKCGPRSKNHNRKRRRISV
jgi:SpoVK/Ycf46/Vps4 family AAA+-type ATPase